MNWRRLLKLAGVVLAAISLWPTPSSAALRLCNQTSYILYTAFGAATKTELDTRGWTRIVPGDCAIPIPDPLTAPAYFIYAHTSRAHSGAPRAWGGNVPICARDTNFSERTKLPVKGCSGADFYKMPFAVLDRHGKLTWTTTFTESPNLRTLQDARRAGINRLLEDLGYRVDVPGERARDLALEDFHKRLRLSADASDADLFAALETEALKAAAPAGYTVCNSTDEALWAAIALQTPKGFVTRGWWQVPGGACSRILTEPLRTDRIFLLAQRKAKRVVVSGPMKLCVADTEFEFVGPKPCKGRGLAEAGFAITETKGRNGYVANIGDNGLLPPAPASAAKGPSGK
jgi:uncharacterized membrane protein